MINKLNKIFHTPTWLFILMLVVLIARIPTFFEPYAYGDEMIYLTLGEAIRKHLVLYKDIHDNKPPLLYVIAALSGSLFGFRAILAIWHIVTIYVFWKLTNVFFPLKGKKRKRNNRLQIVSAVVFAILTTIPLLEGNIANSEIFMIGPTILGFYLLLSKKKNVKRTFLAGVCFSVATLFKIPAAFDVPTIVFYWIATTKLSKKNIVKIAKDTLIMASGFAIPILLTFIYYYVLGAFSEYFIAAFAQNFGYLSSFRPGDTPEPFLIRNAPLIARAVFVTFTLSMLFLIRNKVSKQYLFFTAWIVLTFFAITLSERPYPHYLIQSVPALSVLIGMLFSLENLEQSLVIIPITIFLSAPVYFHFWRYPVLPYYERFFKFATKQMTKEEYYSTFGGNVTTDYEVANFIRKSSRPEDGLFVWGDNGAIYALTRKVPPIKYVADYHINDFSNFDSVITKLDQNKPEFIVILTDSSPFSELEVFIQQNYGESLVTKRATVYKLLSPQVRSLL